LLLLEAEAMPAKMDFAKKSVAGWRALCRRYGRAPATAALQFAARTVPEAFLVVGCETPDQLAGNIDSLRATPLDAAVWDDIMLLPQADDRITRPYLWN
ncbi:MAG: hypothetical protein HOK54_17045, partial [Alphaproteobacteria bacterium]|nr:hypothetical protein [Alphaproteobacteria bacterium]